MADDGLVSQTINVDWPKLEQWCDTMDGAVKILDQLGPNARMIRDHLGLSRQALADELEMKASTLGRWEQQHAMPPAMEGAMLLSYLRGALLDSEKAAKQMVVPGTEKNMYLVDDEPIESEDIDIDQF